MDMDIFRDVCARGLRLGRKLAGGAGQLYMYVIYRVNSVVYYRQAIAGRPGYRGLGLTITITLNGVNPLHP